MYYYYYFIIIITILLLLHVSSTAEMPTNSEGKQFSRILFPSALKSGLLENIQMPL